MTEPEEDAPAAPNFIEVLEEDEGDTTPGLCVPFR
ncbi:hypothetical protein FHX82_005065 [Amycolatopsis bartoniae]|nr:hypothetical protein [Amycolatopsis bartoniae]